MLRSLKYLLVALGCFSAFALVPGARVDNFKLLDERGVSHELYYLSDKKAVVVMVQGNGCPIVRNALPRYRELRDEYQSKGVEFLLINANLQDTREAVRAEASEFSIDIPVLLDETQVIAESLGVVRTAEVFVINPKDWTLTYRGAMDDRLTYERQKAVAHAHYLKDALDGQIADESVTLARTDAVGCIVNMPERDRRAEHQKISYSQTIAPLLIDKCVTCHREGGIGPWAMSDYNMVKGFSLMMREVIRTKRMPPWHADPHVGHFSNDRSLAVAQQQTLLHWIEAGAPRGDGPDPLAEYRPEWPEWALGTPDLIVDIPAFDVPAAGVVDYRYPKVKNPLDHDVWVRAAELQPGDRKVLHHVISRFSLPDGGGERGFGRSRRGGGFGGYVPGNVADEMPAGTGVLLPVGAEFTFQMHYTPTGKATTDRSRLGIYFHKKPPEHRLTGTVLLNPRIRIPPHAAAHSESASQVLKRDVLLYSLLPHSHYRGKASEFRAVFPDGHEEVLLSVPNYDFNWQTTYDLAEPKRLPAGTKLIHTTTWDNSKQNPANPDPDREVPWGQQSWDEMLFGSVRFRYLDGQEDLDEGLARFE